MLTCVILNIFALTLTSALAPEICEKYPAQRYCIIEWMSRDRWPHTKRYTYKWDRRKCLVIRWADYCGTVPSNTNNFDSEEVCYAECGGWA